MRKPTCPYNLSYGHPTYYVNMIKLKREIIWTSGLPHLSEVPQLPVNRPLDSSHVRLTRHLNPRTFACGIWNPGNSEFVDLESVIKVSMKRKPKSSNRNPEFNASVEFRIQDCPGLSYMVTEYSHFHTNEWNKQETTSDSKKGAKMIGEGFKT